MDRASRHIHILSREVTDDLRSAAWLESELHADLDLHWRHQMADICEKGNMDRVWRVLGIGVAEIRMALLPTLSNPSRVIDSNHLTGPKEWRFDFSRPISSSLRLYIKEKIHEYLVALVMADRTMVIIPSAASVWRLRAEEALSALAESAASTTTFARRPLTPF